METPEDIEFSECSHFVRIHCRGELTGEIAAFACQCDGEVSCVACGVGWVRMTFGFMNIKDRDTFISASQHQFGNYNDVKTFERQLTYAGRPFTRV